MPKNRKRSAPAVRLGPVVKVVVVCLLLGLAGVGFVWQKNQIFELGQRMKEKEQRLEKLRLDNLERARVLAHFRSTQYLEEKIHHLKLGLTAPKPEQVYTLTDEGVVNGNDYSGPRYWARAGENPSNNQQPRRGVTKKR